MEAFRLECYVFNNKIEGSVVNVMNWEILAPVCLCALSEGRVRSSRGRRRCYMLYTTLGANFELKVL